MAKSKPSEPPKKFDEDFPEGISKKKPKKESKEKESSEDEDAKEITADQLLANHEHRLRKIEYHLRL